MENAKLRHAIRLAIAASVAATASYALPAMAADGPSPQQAPQNDQQAQQNCQPGQTNCQQAQQLGTISVTGSRIKRTDIETAQPVLRISHAQIESSGYTNVGQLLQSITSSGAAANVLVNNGGGGGTFIDLHYVGANRVLVLLNGRRFNNGLGGAVDLSQIPAGIVDHIEILKDGASAVYGSDAIGGVVNIVTRKDFNGAEGSAFYGKWNGSGNWDGRTTKYSFLLGSQTDHSGVMLGVNYTDQQAIPAADRDWADTPVNGTGIALGSSGTPRGRFQFVVPPQFTSNPNSPNNTIINSPLTTAQCPISSDPIPWFGTGTEQKLYLPECDLTLIPGRSGTKASDFRPYVAAKDAYNYAPLNYLMTPLETTNLFARGHYDITDNVSFFSSVLYNHRTSEQQLAASPLYVAPFSIATTIPAAQNPFGFDLNATGGNKSNASQIGFRPIQFLRTQHQAYNTFRFLGGFKGDFTTGTRLWNWDANYIYALDQNLWQFEGDYNTRRLSNAVAGCPIDTPMKCVPFNFFGGAKGFSQAMVDYGSFTGNEETLAHQRVYSANLSTSNLFDLPAGGLGLAVGYQYREQDGTYTPDSTEAAGLSSGNPGSPVPGLSGRYSVQSVYGELNVPLLVRVPGFYSLSVDLAHRYDDFSTYGTSNTDRVGLKWQPIHDLLIRATWSSGFRAPTIGDLFSAQQASFSATRDPCSSQYRTAAYDARCTAAGVPESYTQPNSQIRTTVGGNPHLQPETSVSKTVGFVYSPGWAQGLSLNADYFKIELQNSISSIGGQTILNACYSTGAFCNLVSRGLRGNITKLIDVNANTGGFLDEGLDGGIQYRLPPTAVGDFSLNLNVSYLMHFVQYQLKASGNGRNEYETQDIQDWLIDGPGSETSPSWKGKLGLNWTYGNWSATAIGHYVGGYETFCSFYSQWNLCQDPDRKDLPVDAVGAAVWWDIQATYDIAAINTSISFGVRNVFGKQPPEDVQAFANSASSYYYGVSLLGRFPYLRATVRF